MGQPGYPILSRVGTYMYWSTVWDNTFTYTNFLHKTLFIKKILTILLTDKISTSLFFQKINNFVIDKQKFPVFNLIKFKNYNESLKTLQKKKVFPNHFGKLWVIKIQNWLILSLYLYLPKKHKHVIKKLNKILKNKSVLFFLFLLKTKYDFKKLNYKNQKFDF